MSANVFIQDPINTVSMLRWNRVTFPRKSSLTTASKILDTIFRVSGYSKRLEVARCQNRNLSRLFLLSFDTIWRQTLKIERYRLEEAIGNFGHWWIFEIVSLGVTPTLYLCERRCANFSSVCVPFHLRLLFLPSWFIDLSRFMVSRVSL